MTLKSQATLLAIVDDYAGGLTYSGAALANNVKPRTVFHWMLLSTKGDPDFLIDYMGEQRQFVECLALGRKQLSMNLRAKFEATCLLGWEERVFFQGRPTWVEEEATLDWTPDEREAFGFARDGLKRDANGNRIQHTIHHAASVAAQIKALEVSFPEEFTPSSNINVINSDTGVMRAAPITGEKVAVPLKPVRPAIEAPAEDADYQDLLGPDPDEDAPTSGNDPEVEGPDVSIGNDFEKAAEPGPRIAEPTPAQYASTPDALLAPRAARAMQPRGLPRDMSDVRAAPTSKVPDVR
jgi:hypothetical protein